MFENLLEEIKKTNTDNETLKEVTEKIEKFKSMEELENYLDSLYDIFEKELFVEKYDQIYILIHNYLRDYFDKKGDVEKVFNVDESMFIIKYGKDLFSFSSIEEKTTEDKIGMILKLKQTFSSDECHVATKAVINTFEYFLNNINSFKIEKENFDNLPEEKLIQFEELFKLKKEDIPIQYYLAIDKIVKRIIGIFQTLGNEKLLYLALMKWNPQNKWEYINLLFFILKDEIDLKKDGVPIEVFLKGFSLARKIFNEDVNEKEKVKLIEMYCSFGFMLIEFFILTGMNKEAKKIHDEILQLKDPILSILVYKKVIEKYLNFEKGSLQFPNSKDAEKALNYLESVVSNSKECLEYSQYKDIKEKLSSVQEDKKKIKERSVYIEKIETKIKNAQELLEKGNYLESYLHCIMVNEVIEKKYYLEIWKEQITKLEKKLAPLFYKFFEKLEEKEKVKIINQLKDNAPKLLGDIAEKEGFFAIACSYDPKFLASTKMKNISELENKLKDEKDEKGKQKLYKDLFEKYIEIRDVENLWKIYEELRKFEKDNLKHYYERYKKIQERVDGYPIKKMETVKLSSNNTTLLSHKKEKDKAPFPKLDINTLKKKF